MKEQQTVESIKSGNRDLTAGNPFRALLLFALPMLLSVLFQQLYNVVDSIIAGRLIGKSALAAVGASTPVTQLFLAIATGASIGCGVIVSQLFGLKETKRLKTAIYTSLFTCAALAVVLTVIGLAICNPLLKLLATPDEIFSDSSAYLAIYVWSLIFIFVYNIVNSVFTGLGDSRTPLMLLIISSVLNVALDLIFVICFKKGVAGLAWATFIAQAFAAVIAFILLILRIQKRIGKDKAPIFSGNLLKKIAVVAVPSICQQSFISVGQLCVQSVINGFGQDTIGGYTAAIKISVMAVSCFTTLSSALSSFTGQNIGAAKADRIKSGLKCGYLLGAVLVVVFVALFVGVGKYLIALFVSGDETTGVISSGQLFLFVVGFGYPFCMLKVCTDGVLRGSGDMTAFMASTLSDLVIRVALSFALAPFLGFLGVCLSYPIGWAGGMALSLIFYARGKWKTKIKV